MNPQLQPLQQGAALGGSYLVTKHFVIFAMKTQLCTRLMIKISRHRCECVVLWV